MSDAQGRFVFHELLPGVFTLSASAKGFKKYEQQDIHVTATERLTLPAITMQVGAITETVSVTGAATPVQTESAERSGLINTRQMQELPLKGRSYMGTAKLLPGVIDKSLQAILDGPAAGGDYWRSEEELALYDSTFGERIGWKWDAVLGELSARGWRPESRRLIDWGCGSGIAGRRVLAHWPGQFTSLALHDRSPLAVRYASAKAGEVEVSSAIDETTLRDSLLLVSHVLNELSDAALAQLVALAGRVREIVWVEPGTHAESRRLGAAVREPLIATGLFPVAPCTHSAACGMLNPENARHWCHSFARPPSSAFQDARWHAFAREIGIDLRALPYSFVVMEHRAERTNSDASRLIGHPREYKGFLKILSCQTDGVSELTLQKRDAPALWRELRDGDGLPLFRWLREGTKILGGEPTT